jgi:hypothetical protein
MYLKFYIVNYLFKDYIIGAKPKYSPSLREFGKRGGKWRWSNANQTDCAWFLGHCRSLDRQILYLSRLLKQLRESYVQILISSNNYTIHPNKNCVRCPSDLLYSQRGGEALGESSMLGG